MAHPKRKTSQSRRDKRRANHKASAPTQTKCPQCGAIVLTHRVCAACGQYRGRQVITIKPKKEKEATASS
jgi:large subunit ribosomal protein L32